jgi:diguanylate cyclase (GGDEF)-like protein
MTALRNLSDSTLADVLAALRREAREATDVRRLVQDLQVHQIELELQNRELRCARQTLEESRDRYADLYDLAPVAYAAIDRQGLVTQMNLTAARLLGVERGSTGDLYLGPRLGPGDAPPLLAALARALDTGAEQVLEVGLVSAHDRQRTLRLLIQRERPSPGAAGPATCRVALLDITEHQRLTEQLRERERDLVQLAHQDPLTGLPNRLLFADRLGQALRRARREQRQVALLFLDLDGFKAINDSLGHPAGDRVLQEAARRLRGQVREGDTLARFGGDEFTLVLDPVERAGDAALVAEKLTQAFKRPIDLDGRPLYVTLSIGISLYPQDGIDVDTLVRNADTAMYQAKDQGRDGFQFYTADMTARAFAQVSLETALREALSLEQFVLYYQPQHDLTTGRIIGVESLIRWHHPTLGLVGPEWFVPLAESSGLIVPIGAWVVRTAAGQLRAWREQGLLADVTLWVNLSNREIRTASLAEGIAATVAESGLEPGALAVEITDIKSVADSESAAENIRRLLDLGIEVAIDSFGTGHSSLASLKRLAVRGLKIDGSFVAGLPGDADDAAIARAIIVLGRALGLRVVAEGIETRAQAESLKAAGCRIGQGYLFSRPLAAAEFGAYCRRG